MHILTTIGSYVTSSGMMPLSVCGFVWETMSEIVRREKLPNLPLEGILSRVADFCDRRTFNRLALTNKQMQEICLKKDKIPWPVLKLPPVRWERQRGLYLSQDSNTLYHYTEFQLLRRWDRRSGSMPDSFVTYSGEEVHFSKDLRHFAAFYCCEESFIYTVYVCSYDYQQGACDRYRILPPEWDSAIVCDVAIQRDICLIDYRDPADIDEPLLVALFDLKTRQWLRMLRGVEAYSISLTNNIALFRGNFGMFQIWHYRNDQMEEPPYSFQLPDHQLQYILDCIPHPTEDRLFCIVSADKNRYPSQRPLLRFGILEVHVSESSGSIDGVTFHTGGEFDEEDPPGGLARKQDLMTWFPCGDYALYLSRSSVKERDRLFLLSFSRSTMKLLPVEPESNKLPRHVQRSFHAVNSFLDEIRSIQTNLRDLQIIVKEDEATSICMYCPNGMIKIVDVCDSI